MLYFQESWKQTNLAQWSFLWQFLWLCQSAALDQSSWKFPLLLWFPSNMISLKITIEIIGHNEFVVFCTSWHQYIPKRIHKVRLREGLIEDSKQYAFSFGQKILEQNAFSRKLLFQINPPTYGERFFDAHCNPPTFTVTLIASENLISRERYFSVCNAIIKPRLREGYNM